MKYFKLLFFTFIGLYLRRFVLLNYLKCRRGAVGQHLTVVSLIPIRNNKFIYNKAWRCGATL